MNPLASVRGAITTGIILALILALAIPPTAFAELGLAHVQHQAAHAHAVADVLVDGARCLGHEDRAFAGC